MPDLLAALQHLQADENTANLQLATGSRINKPSDDPAGAAQLVQINAQNSQFDSFQRSASSISDELSTADSTLNSVTTALQRAISLGTEGANGTLSDSDRADVAGELQGIQNQLISLANTTFQGHFLFAGTVNAQPFVVDGTQPSGVRYDGNQGVNSVAIGNGYPLQVNLPGSQIFNGSGADVFQAVQNLIAALNTNSGAGAAVNQVDEAYNYITSQRVFYGNGLNQLQLQQTYLQNAKLGLAQQQNTVGAADIASAATQLVQDETNRTAALTAIGRIQQNSLFDYLR